MPLASVRAAAARIPPPVTVTAVAALTAGTALLRRQPLSWDEAVTVAVAGRPVHAIVATLHHSDAVLGAYYLLVHGWLTLLADAGVRPTETWSRLLSALAAVATCTVVAVLARRSGGTAAGLVAGCTLAVLPLFAFYAVDARPYTLAALAAVAAWAVWTRPAPTRRPLLDATMVTVLLIVAGWLQLFTVLVWPAFLLVAGRRGARRAVAVLLVSTAGVVPLVSIALRQSSEIGWIPAATATNTLRVALHVGGGVAVVVLGLLFLGIAARARRGRPGRTAVAVAWWCCAPLVLLAAVDTVRPVLVARYVLVSLPLVAVALGVLAARGGPGRAGIALRAAGAATLVACAVTTALELAQPWKYEDYRGAAHFAARAVPPGTPVLFAPSSARLGFDRYAGSSTLDDLALPGGVGPDPLAIPELAPASLRGTITAACRVVLVGDPLTTPARARSATDRAKVDAVAGWPVESTRGYGAVTVTVVANPACVSKETSTG